ncbi:MAG: BlaI/MecI/CopY family transcriptional regulator [Planctomycetota bacterium]
MGKKHQLAELQLAIMHVLWERGEATVSEVREGLSPQRNLAHTTVGTMLTKMEEKGHVRHRSEGRSNVYRPAIRREQVSQTMVSDLAQRLFGGDIKQMVCHLLDDEDLTADDLAELKRLIRRREKEMDG